MKLSIFSLFLVSLLAFTSCDKQEDFDKDKKEYDKENYDQGDKDKAACFTMVFPLTWTMPDGSTPSFDDEKTMWTDIKAWYEANPDAEAKPTLNYPVDILMKDGTSKTLADEAGMTAFKKEECGYKDKVKACFKMVYPVMLAMPDGAAFEVDSEKEMWGKIKAWSKANPDSDGKPELNYPVEVILLADESSQTVADEAAMIALKKSCEEE